MGCLHAGKGLRPLRDTAAFALASVGEGGHSVVWPGDIDLGAARLFETALEQKGVPMRASSSDGGGSTA